MSSYNPAPKTGFTKTGKSLKAVRRYYALLNQKKSPDDDKLSKRIAVELKTQQDANEKRGQRDGSQPLLEQSTERSEMPPRLIVSPKETGPVFIAPPPPPPPPPPMEVIKSARSAKSIKSMKSTKSTKGADYSPETFTRSFCSSRMLYFMLGFFIGIIVGTLAYVGISKVMNANV